MNKTTNLLTKVTTSVLIFSLVFAVSESKASAADKLPLGDRAVPEMSKQFVLSPVAVVVRETLEKGELQFSEMLTINGLALAASGLVGIRRFRQGKKVNGL
ncbi:hypothetical protein BCD67_18180 [Oscillatoriales cyanobacterium USR001]|nr:hypothetical protein BCD67_18180 [Oscillatoriales cyanobacterium USR001]